MKTIFKSLLFLLSCAASVKINAQTPILSSYPGASATIFLDFDGHTVTGTSWNYNGPILCAPSGLTDAQITSIFNRVAEDYRPFNVNVTTDSTKFLAAPINKRMRVIETTSYEWYGNAGGVAFIGSFTWGDDSPCFVFTSLLNYNQKNIAEASSHEAGHTLHLQHQSVYNASCVKTAEYNLGYGSGEIGWAPIMGAGYYQNMTQWNNGKSTVHCDSVQNDLAIITTTNGFGYRADEYGNDFASATYAPFVNNSFTLSGLIAQNNDLDMIRITQPANGRFQLSASPYNVGSANSGSNLDLEVSLYNSAQTLLKIYNPDDLLSVSIDTMLLPGTYYLKIQGGANIYAPNYASLGEYSLSATFSVSTLPLKRLELSGEATGGKHKLNWIVEADETITKQLLEVSTDGIHFDALSEAINTTRSFVYTPHSGVALQYRMNVTFDNGRQHFSNIVLLKGNNDITGPKLIGNMVTTNLTVNSAGNYDYSIFEMTGRLAARGSITNGRNNLNTGSLNKSMYIIRFNNGSLQWTEKFIRQ
jgi:hypothetical protein